ncbi:hypothetical protein BDV59DRAFT_173596 [Aspergillus ambiguus]|uniref:uncharacterized protein n=1 Tax=Aspergillus ambiguus TaxID=176160 RepID=UPI003CCCC8A9
MQLIQLRGGLEELFDTTEFMRPALLHLIIVGVIGNTTCPPAQQVHIIQQNRDFNLIERIYCYGSFPGILCPPHLFVQIARVNQFRYNTGVLSIIEDSTRDAAYRLLEDIEGFSPTEWAKSSFCNQDDWLLVGGIYQSAVIIYCIASLQSLSVLPSTSQLDATRAAHGHSLLSLLEKSLLMPQMKKCMLWPLVVAGMEMERGTASSRQFVSNKLDFMSRDLGTPIAKLAKAVLWTFWAGGKDSWDECFSQPYAFVT